MFHLMIHNLRTEVKSTVKKYDAVRKGRRRGRVKRNI
jgi:hypothetical protein